jgi:predicted small lipoprotein YifL
MKKLLVSVVALATVITFTSCGDDEKAPEITLPTDATTLVIDLGDETAALAGVTAKDDKDGDVTNSLRVEGLDYVGNGGLVYYAKDNGNNEGKATRPATITSTKLAGTYFVTQTGAEDKTYTSTVTKSSQSDTKLVVSNLDANADFSVVFVGSGNSTTMTMEPHTFTSEGYEGVMSGTLEYKKSGTSYVLYEMTYKVTWDDGEVENYSAELEAR